LPRFSKRSLDRDARQHKQEFGLQVKNEVNYHLFSCFYRTKHSALSCIEREKLNILSGLSMRFSSVFDRAPGDM